MAAAANDPRAASGVLAPPSCGVPPARLVGRRCASRSRSSARSLRSPWEPEPTPSRPQALEQAREGNRLAHVVEAAQPGDAALDAPAHAGVRHGAVAAEGEVPAEAVERKLVPSDLSPEPGARALRSPAP